MKQLRLALLALRVGASAAVWLSASATAMSLGPTSLGTMSLRPAAAGSMGRFDAAARLQPPQGRLWLAQYGDDDDAPAQPQQQHHHHQQRGGHGGNLNGILNIVVPLISEGARDANRQ